MKPVFTRLSFIIALIALLAACQPEQAKARLSNRAWTLDDLRVVEAAGQADPGLELVALYVRDNGPDLQVRLDLLDLQPEAAGDITLRLDAGAGGVLVRIPAAGEVSITQADGAPLAGALLRVQVDALMDTVVVKLRHSALGARADRLTVEAGTTWPDGSVADRIGPAGPDARGGQANVVFLFHDALSAASPAQALRRWDGAHSGPLGQRHGLKPLLQAVETYRMPIFLLDLKTPESLSALDALGGLEYVDQLARRGLVTLADTGWGDPLAWQDSAAIAAQVSREFGLRPSGFSFGLVDTSLFNHTRLVFAVSPDTGRLASYNGVRIIPAQPIPFPEDSQASMDGPTLATRRALLAQAADSRGDRLTVLGRPLPDSTWGDASAATATFAWLAVHPWIKALYCNELLRMPAVPLDYLPCGNGLCAGGPLPDSPVYNTAGGWAPGTLAGVQAALLEKLRAGGNDDTNRLAWLSYLELADANASGDLWQLKAGYLGTVGHLLAARDWADDPREISDCAGDLDYDGQPECVLANARFFGVFESDGARLALAFAIQGGMPRQLVAQSGQFAVGLSDPSTWRLDRGAAGDPGAIPGGFSDAGFEFAPYTVATGPGRLVFTRVDGELVKTFTLAADRLTASYSAPVERTQVALAPAATERFAPGWIDQPAAEPVPGGWRFQTKGGAAALLTGNAEMTVTSYLDSANLLRQPEDPDAEYPPGHYLPFPLTLVEIRSVSPLTVQLQFP